MQEDSADDQSPIHAPLEPAYMLLFGAGAVVGLAAVRKKLKKK